MTIVTPKAGSSSLDRLANFGLQRTSPSLRSGRSPLRPGTLARLRSAVIWDRSRSWVIERHEVGRGRVHVHFDAPLSLKQMVAIRRVFPEFASAQPDEIRSRVSA